MTCAQALLLFLGSYFLGCLLVFLEALEDFRHDEDRKGVYVFCLFVAITWPLFASMAMLRRLKQAL